MFNSTKIQRPYKNPYENDGKPEISDFVGAPLPGRLEGCGRLLRRQSLQTATADGKPEISDFVGAPLPRRLGLGLFSSACITLAGILTEAATLVRQPAASYDCVSFSLGF
ncbi:hypothetical protein DDV21_003240 [Streptococcus chenjunshii]|uniref:Uncharacterized protein n=1 Tax=Streptococcus chenjunshii TaxID=2173853 RepID=A0A372KMG1_9STRE|nr:hypothetical protein DDV21_003240 [Streptococcus chenjunshii]RFU50695.1 hypothetical protein DDV22_07350 [Streptococcus chenjunshii]RFU53467.1 hypothetical protein DDV23_04530 [Streptococcus chenjunshii]